MKLPHWAQLAIGLAVVVLTWVVQQSQSGGLALPAAVTTVLTMVLTVLGLLSPSASAAANKRAAGGFVGLRLLGGLTAVSALCTGLLLGCPQAIPAVQPTEQCVSAVIADALAGLNVNQILDKDGGVCGQDLAVIIAVLLQSSRPAVQATVAYKDAVSRQRPIVVVVDAGGP